MKKWKLLSSYKTRRASSNPNNLLSFPCEHCEPPVADSDLNGLCEPSSIQCSQIVKRPPEIGEFVYMYMALTCFFVLQSIASLLVKLIFRENHVWCIYSTLKFGNEAFEKPHRATLKTLQFP